MNFWQHSLLVLGAAALGWFACDVTKASQRRQESVALQQSMLDYSTRTTDAQARSAEAAIAILTVSERLRAENAGKVQTIIREVQNAPDSTSCMASPAVRVALDGLRQLAEARPGDPDPVPAPGNVSLPVLAPDPAGRRQR